MPDPPKNLLTSFYQSRINDAKAYLKARYPLTVYDADDDEVKEIPKSLPKEFSPCQLWRVELPESTFIVAIPTTFPDTFPKIYLPKEDHEKIYPVPHVDTHRFVCTRDPEIVVINDKKPGEALEKLLEIAAETVDVGIKKENLIDYVEEFVAYWAEKTDMVFLSLFTPEDRIMLLHIYTLSDMLLDAWHLISDSDALVARWVTPLGTNIVNEKGEVALYLPLEELPPKFFDFENKKGVLEILKNLKNTTHTEAVTEYFNRVDGPVTLIMSFPTSNERVLFGWTFPGWNSVRGFRKNKVPLLIRLAQTDQRRIKTINIKRMDKERILERGGSNFLAKKDMSVTIIGCGSLGSYLAMSLARCGMSKYFLIDKEDLEPENVARHLCGFVDISKKMKKVQAVKKRLQEHFPHIECETYDDDVLNLLYQEGTGWIETYDLAIIAIGNMAIEKRINYLVRKTRVKKPIYYLWMEPLGVGGHVLFISADNGGCFNCCFNREGQFLYQIAAKDQTFSKREAGCQTTYFPYSSVEVEHFISVVCRWILRVTGDKEKRSSLFTWLGSLEEFTSLGFKVSDRYVTDSSYTTIEKEIVTNRECELCRTEEQAD